MHPQWLLVSQTSKPMVTPSGPVAPQLLLFDARTLDAQAGRSAGSSGATLSMFWEDNPAKTSSAYTVPAWSRCGNYIACGSASGLVNVWDIRCCTAARKACQSLRVCEERVLVADWTTGTTLVTASTLGKIGTVCW